MKKSMKLILSSAVAAGNVYGICTLMDELLFNRKLIMSPKINSKISGCDSSHLGKVLADNLQFVEDYGYEKHYITSDRGEKLTGYLMKTKEPSDIYVFGAHGYRSYGKKEICGFAKFYLENGINVFFPDHIASGESEGTYCTFGYYEKEDCMKWLSYMTENFGKDIKIILHGLSMGSAIVCMMSGREDLPDNVKFTVADCGFTTSKALFEYKMEQMGLPHRYILKAVNLVHRINHGFDLREIAPVQSVKNAKVPMLFVHGRKDNLVPSFMAEELYNNCGSEYKDILIVEEADHVQSHLLGEKEYEDKILKFAEKFITKSISNNH